MMIDAPGEIPCRGRALPPAVLVCILDIMSTFQIVSTKSGEAHADRGLGLLGEDSTSSTSALTTVIYTHPADEELAERVRDLPC